MFDKNNNVNFMQTNIQQPDPTPIHCNTNQLSCNYSPCVINHDPTYYDTKKVCEDDDITIVMSNISTYEGKSDDATAETAPPSEDDVSSDKGTSSQR